MLKQSIELARAPRLPRDAGAHRRRARRAAQAPRRRHRCRCCACRRSATTSRRSSAMRGCCRRTPPTWCCSAPAARASAARRWRSLPATPCPALGALRKPRAAFHRQPRSRHVRGAARATAARHHALRRDLEVGRHRRDADADRRGTRRAQGRQARPARSSSRASPSRPKPGKANGLRDLLGPHDIADARPRSRRRRPLLGADQCRAAAGRGVRPRHRRDPRRRRGCARAGAGRQAAGRGAGRGRRRAVGRLPASRSR